MKHPKYKKESYQSKKGDQTPYIFLNYIALLSYIPSLYKQIDEQFEKDAQRYHMSAKSSDYYEYVFFKNIDIEREMYCKKLVGIMNVGLENEPQLIDWIIELGKKPYIRVYQFMEKCERIDDDAWMELMKIFREKEKRLNNNHFANSMLYEADNLFISFATTGEFYHGIHQHMIVVKFLNVIYSKKITLAEELNTMYEELIDEKTRYDSENLEYMTFEQAETQRHKEEAIALKKLFLNPFIHKTEDFFDETEDDYGIYYDNLSDENLEASDVYYLFQHYKDRYSLQFESVFKFNSKKELEKKVTELAMLSPYKRPKDHLKAIHFMFIGLFIDSMLSQLRKNRDYFLQHNSEYIQREKSQDEEKTKALEDEIANLKEKIRKQEEELSAKNKIIKDFQKEKESSDYKHGQIIKKLEKTAKKHEKEKEEQVFLKEFYHAFQQKEQEKEQREIRVVGEKDLALINNKQLLIVGGKENWKNTLSQRVNADFLYYEQSNFDRKIISRYDYVFFNTNYMNHGMFYKVMNELKKQNVGFGFLNRTNVEYNILEMLDYLQKMR